MKITISDITKEEAEILLKSEDFKTVLYELDEYLWKAEKYGTLGQDNETFRVVSQIREDFHGLMCEYNISLIDE